MRILFPNYSNIFNITYRHYFTRSQVTVSYQYCTIPISKDEEISIGSEYDVNITRTLKRK